MRIENLDWDSRVIFVPDSKTEEGRRRVPMSNRIFDVLKKRCGTSERDGFSRRNVLSAGISLRWPIGFARLADRLGCLTTWSSIEDGTITARGFSRRPGTWLP